MKIFQLITIPFSFLFFISVDLYSQDVLFKKDSVVIKVNIIEFNGKTVAYQIPGDSLKITHYISKSVLDSLKYRDGKSLSFFFQEKVQVPRLGKRNFIGFDIVNLFKSNLNIEYERMFKNGNTSFVAGLLINSHPNGSGGWEGYRGWFQYFNFNTHYFFTKLGINFYPFNYSLAQAGDFRFSSGLSLLLGSYRQINYSTYPYEHDPVFAANLMWKLNAALYLTRSLKIDGGVEISLLPFLGFLCPEICLSIGF